MSIGEALQQVRQKRELTQQEVASKLYVTRQTISRWEQDKTIPNIYALKDLAELYDVSIDDLINTKLLNPKGEEGNKMRKINWLALFGLFWFNLIVILGLVVGVFGIFIGLWITVLGFILGPLLLVVEWLFVEIFQLAWPQNLTWYQIPAALVFCGIGMWALPRLKDLTNTSINYLKKYIRYNLKSIYYEE